MKIEIKHLVEVREVVDAESEQDVANKYLEKCGGECRTRVLCPAGILAHELEAIRYLSSFAQMRNEKIHAIKSLRMATTKFDSTGEPKRFQLDIAKFAIERPAETINFLNNNQCSLHDISINSMGQLVIVKYQYYRK